jgi:hypothetical protein
LIVEGGTPCRYLATVSVVGGGANGWSTSSVVGGADGWGTSIIVVGANCGLPGWSGAWEVG